MNTSEIIFIDFPINKYLYGLYVKEVYIRKPLSKAIRFLRKLPLFSMLISNTREIKGWTLSCKYAKTIIIFDTFANYALYCHKIEKEASKEARLILYLLNPVFSQMITNFYQADGKYGHSWKKTLRSTV